MKSIKNYKSQIITGIICSAITSGIAWYALDYSRRDIIEAGERFKILSECRDIISKNGTAEFNDDSAFLGAINGYLQDGGDKYTYYFQSENADDVKLMTNYVNTAGTALASGFQVECSEDGYIRFTDITSGLAADKQGIMQDDIVIEINGEDVKKVGYENIVNKLLGKQDTTVNLKIKRNEEIIEINFVRDHIYLRDVNWKMIDDEIAYIKIDQFEQFSAGTMSSAMDEIGDSQAFIVDLRDNRGGMVDICVQAADWFSGENVVEIHKYNGELETYSTHSANTIEKDVVLIINGNTASAAEIFTALVKQSGKNVTLVGENTFGKGIFQQEADLSDGGKLHYTAGYYTVGDWDCYQGVGIAPDVEVEMDSSLIGTDNDIQLQKAIEILKK